MHDRSTLEEGKSKWLSAMQQWTDSSCFSNKSELDETINSVNMWEHSKHSGTVKYLYLPAERSYSEQWEKNMDNILQITDSGKYWISGFQVSILW